MTMLSKKKATKAPRCHVLKFFCHSFSLNKNTRKKEYERQSNNIRSFHQQGSVDHQEATVGQVSEDMVCVRARREGSSLVCYAAGKEVDSTYRTR